MGNPNVHDHVNLPILVAGGGAGTDQGRPSHPVRGADAAGQSAPDAARRVGVRLDAFADSKGKVDELLTL